MSKGLSIKALKTADSVQTQLDQAVASGDQLAETQQARVDTSGASHTTLKERIDSDVQNLKQKDNELSSQLAQKASQLDLNTEKGRIDNLVVNAGDTDGNAELLDVRVALGGQIYPTAGESVRSAHSKVDNLSEEYYKNFPVTNLIKVNNIEPYRATKSVDGDVVIATGNGESAIMQLMYRGIPRGVQNYVRLMVRVRDDECQSIHVMEGMGTDDERSLIVENPVRDQWYEVSRVKYWQLSFGNDVLAIRSRYPDAVTQSGKILEIKYLVLINLNQLYDVSSPYTPLIDVAEINNLISKFPNRYFEGTKNAYTTKEIYKEFKQEIETVKEEIANLEPIDTTVEHFAHWTPIEKPLVDLNITYEDFINNYWEKLRAEHPDNITRTLIINDTTNTYPIYRYVFEPEEYSKTVFLTAGMHGNEFEAYWSVYNLMNHIYNHYTTDERLKHARSKIRFIIIPVLNPYGFNNFTRENGQEIDPNRNFDVMWNQTMSLGDEPFDQNEALALKLVADKYEGEIDLYIDNHTSPPFAQEAGTKYIYTVMRPESPLVEDASEELVYFTNYWNDLYNKNLPTYYKSSNNSTSNNYMFMVRGVPSLTTEFVSTNFAALGSPEEMERAYEFYGNIILKLVNNIDKNRIKKETFLQVYADQGVFKIDLSKSEDFRLTLNTLENRTIQIKNNNEWEKRFYLYVDCKRGNNLSFDGITLNEPVNLEVGKVYKFELETIDKGVNWFGTLQRTWQPNTVIEIDDTFSRPDSNTVGQTETGGHTWSTKVGTGFKIESNKLIAKATGKQVAGFHVPSSDFEISADIEWMGLSGFAIRGDENRNNWYRLTMGASEMGLFTDFDARYHTISFSPEAGRVYNFKARCEGTLITVYLDDVEMIRYTDTEVTKNNYVGVFSFSSTNLSKFDNFKVKLL